MELRAHAAVNRSPPRGVSPAPPWFLGREAKLRDGGLGLAGVAGRTA
jgi:hypothetical protein